MTNKQIIIDGVDVSGCENLMQGIVLFGCMEDRKTCSCMNNPNCLYKQLKRKEYECSEYSKELIRFQQEVVPNLRKQLRNKEQTLKEIKEMCSEMDCESLMENSWCGNTDFKIGCCEKFFKKQILQIIRESEIKHES